MRRQPGERVEWRPSLHFIAFHFVPLLAIWTGVTTRALVFCAVAYVVRVMFITAGYHRYFSHRTYRLRRVPQFLLALGGLTCVQKGPLWWAAHHRAHHRYSDTPLDPHTPKKGAWWSHMGWIMSPTTKATDMDRVRDLAKFPELQFLNRNDWIGPWLLGVLAFLVAGWSGLIVGFFLSTILVWHGTFLINSGAHLMGRRRYATTDTSRNSLILAIITMGEGWHNNHHHYQASCRQGFRWYQWDPTYYVIKAASWVGLVRDIKGPTARVLESKRIDQGALDIGIMLKYTDKAGDQIERASALDLSEQAAIRASLEHAGELAEAYASGGAGKGMDRLVNS